MSTQDRAGRAARYMWNPEDLHLRNNKAETWPVDDDELEYGMKDTSRIAKLKFANDEHREELEALARAFFKQGYPRNSKVLHDRLDALREDFETLLHEQVEAGYHLGVAHAPQAKERGRFKQSRNSRQALNRIEDRSYKYFNQYLDDLRDNVAATTQLDFNSLMGRFENRIGMYSSGQWQSVWQGFGDALDSEAPVTRVLDDLAEHCATCPVKAKTYDNFTAMVDEAGVPGDGSDDCGGNCRCQLEPG